MTEQELTPTSPLISLAKHLVRKEFNKLGLDFALSEMRLLREDYLKKFPNCPQSQSVAKRFGELLQECQSASPEKAEEILTTFLSERP